MLKNASTCKGWLKVFEAQFTYTCPLLRDKPLFKGGWGAEQLLK